MGRIIFPKYKQSTWINKVLDKTGLKVNEIAKICNVSPRTIRDWRREKYTVSENALLKLQKCCSIPIPTNIKRVSDYWYVSRGARKGALRRLELYGPPGTPEGRRKGGQISQLRRKLHPELYPNCILRKNFSFPKKSTELAELVGIILGDGGITDYQLKITLNKETEPEFIEFVTNLIKKLFGEAPQKYYFKSKRKDKTCNICLGGIDLIKYLQDLGLKKGNKVVHQVGVPRWVSKNIEYSKACLRGLVDTDGAIYYHRHFTKGFSCFNLGLTLTNYSRPLVEFAQETLLKYGFSSRLRAKSVYIYRINEINKYFDIIGSHNTHHVRRLRNFYKLKNLRRSTQAA